MDSYILKAFKICMQLMEMIAKVLDLPGDYFEQYFKDPNGPHLRLLEYSREPSSIENGVFACGPHTDYGCMTLLLTNEVPGL